MKEIHLVFWFLVLSFVATTQSMEFQDETLKKLLIRLKSFEDKNQDNQSGSSPESLDLSVDEDESVDENEDVLGLSLPKCGQPIIEPNINQKIVNGKPARPNSWPWQISLQIKNSEGMYRHICGGSIIANNVVLTAAHCLLDVKYSDLFVIAGEHDQSVRNETIQIKKLKRMINHPLFFYNQTAADTDIFADFIGNDIAVLILETPLTYQDSVSPVCLPNTNPDLNSLCYATGWGSTYQTDYSNILNQIRLPILSKEKCRKIDRTITDTELCSKLQNGYGGLGVKDSGGPLVCLEGNAWYLHGISSYRNIFHKRVCYNVFTRVYSFLDWIKGTTGVVS